ncbi:MAG: 50S ribosomal protein L25 [Polyangiaceae bacterium]|nr:50S ribosomal protein L25 [Polyangiaceae bacterium]
MIELHKIAAKRRADAGKSSSRRLRRDALIPAVAYGQELPAVSLAVSPKDLATVLASEHGRNTVLELDVEGDSPLTVMLRDYQYHPVSRSFLHADFVQIHLDRPVDVSVPLELTGKAQGIVLGGVLRQVFRRLPIRCLPDRIPTKISHDITELGLDGHVFVSDVTLPEGVEVRLAPNQTLVAIVAEKAAEEETTTAAAAPGTTAAPVAAASPEAPVKASGKASTKS